MSACCRPIWGRAEGALSIFTDSAGRPAFGDPPDGSPVSGNGGPAGTVVEVEVVVVVGAAVVVAFGATTGCLPPHAASTTKDAVHMTAPAPRQLTGRSAPGRASPRGAHHVGCRDVGSADWA